MFFASPTFGTIHVVLSFVGIFAGFAVLGALLSRNVPEGSLLLVTNTATDSDTPAQRLTFHLLRQEPAYAEALAEAVDPARWMHTGDLATIDAEGYCAIVGRIKDMIIRGGENVYPREIEEFLYTHADIVDVQVVGVPDVKYGEEIMAWVRLREGAQPLGVDEVRTFCQGRIAHYKVPRYVHVVDEFPMTVTGKIQKYKLRDAAVELLGLHDAASIRTA